MNVKSLKKQLMAAIAMVCVAAIALGSSTYAWFVASGTVTAKGMNVTAQSEGGLAISYNGGAWGTSAQADLTGTGDSAKQLYPASTLDLNNWYHATAHTMDKSAAENGTRTNITTEVFGGVDGAYDSNNSYVVMREFQIKSTATDNLSKGLFVKDVKVTTAAQKTMSTALRVGVSYTTTGANPTTTKFIYGPVSVNPTSTAGNTPTNNYTVYGVDDNSLGSVTLGTVGKDNSTLIGESVPIPGGDDSITVQIYIWFEGEDLNLRSNNFNVEDMDVNVEFSSIA